MKGHEVQPNSLNDDLKCQMTGSILVNGTLIGVHNLLALQREASIIKVERGWKLVTMVSTTWNVEPVSNRGGSFGTFSRSDHIARSLQQVFSKRRATTGGSLRVTLHLNQRSSERTLPGDAINSRL